MTPAQLETARRCQAEFGLEFPLVEASAEDVPLPSESFDLAVSEYGASIWCDPHLWIPEAYRLLRPGGRLWFLRNSTLAILCAPDDEGKPTDRLRRPQRGLGRLEWPGELGVEWQLPHGELFRLLRRTGFDVVDLVELYPPDDAVDHPYYDGVLGRVGAQVAGRGDLGREEARMTNALTALALASTSPQRRAILEQLRIPFTAVAPVVRGARPARRRPGRRSCATTPRARRDRCTRRARRRSASTRPCISTAGSTARPPTATTRAPCSASSPAARTAWSRGSACSATASPSSSMRRPNVTFRTLSAAEIEAYLESEEWDGRAGSYAIQGLGARLVARIDGDYLNVVGLPAALLIDTLAAHAPNLLQID